MTKTNPLLSTLSTESNPFLLELLEMGAEIVLPDGRWMVGDPDSGYIDFGVQTGESLGLWELNRNGLRNLLGDPDFVPLDEEDTE